MTNHCTPEQSLALKEIGFDMPVRDNYREKQVVTSINEKDWNDLPWALSAPTRSEVLQWAREKHGIDAWVESIYDFDNVKKYIFIIHKHDDSRIKKPTHPEAESALVNKIIEIIKEKKA
jgi:hypothetical protein